MGKKYYRIMNFIISLMFVFLCFPQKIHALDKINVGYIDYKGFIEKDKSGAYSGYAVDYLNEISKYTQWEYHYIYDSWEQCLEKLKDGKIDILCSAQYTKQRDQDFDYSKYPIGNEYTMIYTNPDEKIYFNDFQTMNHKKIGLLKDSYQNQSLKTYAKQNHFTYQEQYYNNEEDVINALAKKEVDMIAVGSLPLHHNVKVVAKFDPQPFYIMVKEGNTELLDQINAALSQIRNHTPYFEMGIYEKYYSNSSYSTQPLLTHEEIEYIQNIKTIDIAFDEDSFPFSYYSEDNKKEGILIDMLNKMSEKTGLQMNYHFLSRQKEKDEFIKQKNHFYCGSSLKSKDVIEGKVYSSNTLLEVDQVIVLKKDKVLESLDDMTIALTFDLESQGQEFVRDFPDACLQFHTTIDECLEAVRTGEADITMNNAYTMNYLIQQPEYLNTLTARSISLEPYGLCMIGENTTNDMLISIFNKTIDSFNKVEKDKLVYNYTIGLRYEYSMLENIYLYRYSIFFIVVIVVIIFILIAILNKRHTEYLIDKKETDILRKKFEIDSLTGLYNAEAFYDKVDCSLKENQGNFFILYIDVNRFKIVNELYGMKEGNRLLCFIAEYLDKLNAEYPDIISCHFNADKFFVFAPQQAYQKLTQVNLLEGYHVEMDISLRYGIYYITDYSIPVNLMCDRAALASQDIKGNYFQRLGVYNDKKRLQILQEQQIINDIQSAIFNHELFIMIQPKYDIFEEKIIGGEALVRWKHPSKGYIPPNEFIPIIENNGYIIRLDYYVWEATCQFLQRMKKQDINLTLSVNVSRLNFYRPHFVELLLSLVEKYDIEPSHLQLEITESVYSKDKEYIYSIIRELQSKGFVILMDDFGSGYSSLNMLKDAPLDIIKLDMDFLGTTETKRSRLIIETVVNLTHSLNMPAIVEGVETAEQVAFLKSIQAHYIQGYYFSKPLLEDDFTYLFLKTNKKNHSSLN